MAAGWRSAGFPVVSIAAPAIRATVSAPTVMAMPTLRRRAAPVTGAAFGFGWTPCLGPILTSFLAVAATQGRAGRGALLMAAYSLGLGIPFLATGLAFGRISGALSWVKRHNTGIGLASSGALGVFGVVLALNRMVWVTTQFRNALGAIGLQRLIRIG